MGKTCVHEYTYIDDYTCLCCDDVETKYLESKNHLKDTEKALE